MKSPRQHQIPLIKPKSKCMMSAESLLRTESGTNFHSTRCRFEFEFKFSRRSLFLCSDFHQFCRLWNCIGLYSYFNSFLRVVIRQSRGKQRNRLMLKSSMSHNSVPKKSRRAAKERKSKSKGARAMSHVPKHSNERRPSSRPKPKLSPRPGSKCPYTSTLPLSRRLAFLLFPYLNV